LCGAHCKCWSIRSDQCNAGCFSIQKGRLRGCQYNCECLLDATHASNLPHKTLVNIIHRIHVIALPLDDPNFIILNRSIPHQIAHQAHEVKKRSEEHTSELQSRENLV